MLLRSAVCLTFYVVVSGCVTSFNKEASAAIAAGQISVPKCENGGKFASVEPARASISFNVDEAEIADIRTEDRSDLQLGVEIMRGQHRTFGLEFGKLGFDYAQFQDQLMLMDEAGAASAGAATNAKVMAQIFAMRTDSETRISRADWSTFEQSLMQATASSGWAAEFARTLGKAANARSRSDTSFGGDLQAAAKQYLLAAYMAAYFRNGQIFQLSFDAAGLKAKVIEKLKQKITDAKVLASAGDEIDSVTNDFEKKLCGDPAANSSCNILGVLGQETFVTRAGKSYGFPGVSATLDPTASRKISTNKINTNDVIEDLIRVFFEAVGDDVFKVPGAPNSTLCKVRSALCAPASDAAALQVADNAGDSTEAATAAVVSAGVRGGWLFAINNETLADSITTATAVVARKIAEDAAYRRAKSTCEADAQLHRKISVSLVP